MDKPPFRLPTMAEVERARGTNGLTVVSTFSGCGGSCMGFEQAGYDLRYAVEFIPAAQEVYRLNHPGVFLDTRDVRLIKPEEILERIGLAPGELDVLEGSPPCASFSSAGKGSKGWGQVKKYSDTKQRTDDLFFEYVRLLKALRPRAFVAENVSGLVKGDAYGYFVTILEKLRACGYRVKARLLEGEWLGVPQARDRLIFVGVREDLGLEPVFPRPLPYFYSMRDALPHLQRFTSAAHGTFNGADEDGTRPAPTVLASPHGGAYYNTHLDVTEELLPEDVEDLHAARLDGTAIGKEWDKLGPGGQSEKYFQLVKPDMDKPTPTITAAGGGRGVAGVTHPTERRKFTINELKRLCAFPSDFQLTGSYTQRWERLGRSVPPRMMFHVARTLRDELFAPLGRVRPGFTEAP